MSIFDQSGYTFPDLQELAQKVGFSPDKSPLAAAIMMAESSGNPFAANEKGEHSYGLSQINADAHGPIAKTALGNPEQAAKLMLDISKGGTDFSPWSAYKNGAYKQYLGKNMYPPFGNARALSALMPTSASSDPNDPTGASAMGAGGVGDVSASIGTPSADTGGLYGVRGAPDPGDPTSVAATGGLYSAPSSGGMGQIAELLKSLGMSDPSKLLQGMGGGGTSTSRMLANMAAGFLGGKGPAASLAGGFAGLANSQKNDQDSNIQLAKLALAFGPAAQQQIEQKKLANAAAMTRTGAVGMGTALRLNGLDPMQYGGSDEKTLNEQTFSDKPMPATTQKQVDTHLQSISTNREQRSILTSLQDDVKNGVFNPTAFNMKVMYPTAAALGNPTGDPGVVAYQKWNAASHALSNEILRGNAGVQTDADAKQAMAILTGGGITSPDQFNQHVNFLLNRGALAEKQHRFQVDQTYKNNKRGKFNWDEYEQNLPGSPPEATAKEIGQNPYGALNVGQPKAASQGDRLKGAVKMPDGRIKLPDGTILNPVQLGQ